MRDKLVALAVAVGLARPAFLVWDFNRHIDMSYQAIAHILIGVLLGAWLLNREIAKQGHYDLGDEKCSPWVMRTFWSLTAVEVVCAAIGVAVR